MKYTKYLLKGDFIDIEPLESKEHPLYNVPLAVVSLPLALIIIGGIAVMMPVAFTFDSTRNVRCMMIRFDRRHNLTSNVHEAVVKTRTYRVINDKANMIKDKIEEDGNRINDDINRSMKSIYAMRHAPVDFVNRLPVLVYKVGLSIQTILF
jgi:hypothetical protein